MRVLITGGAGFVGSHLAEEFLRRGDTVLAFDSGPPDKVRHLLRHPCFSFIRGSVLDEDVLDRLIAECDLVYHLAAVVGVDHYVAAPQEVLDVNINGTQNVLKAACKRQRKVVFGSTSEVYGRNPKVPWSEDDDRVLGSTRVDRWCYATSKAVGEHFCFAYHRLGLPVTVLRYFNVYGPRLDQLDSGRVVTVFLGQALRGEPITVIGNGRQTRCFTYVDDCVRATVAAGVYPGTDGEVFNIGTNVETTILELAQLIIELTGTRSPIRFVSSEDVYGSSYEDIPRRVPDVSKMRTVLGLCANTSLRVGLQRTIDWFRQQAAQAGVVHAYAAGPQG
ncbi:MAG: NAD-dependent epimerase/dehydratase family protein [Candidatus Binatia bacterium]|nr:NAD-dependent epimerase/dehydratase family protein [Candidatus Binatia bacterium]